MLTLLLAHGDRIGRGVVQGPQLETLNLCHVQVSKDESRLPSRSDSGLSLVKDKEGRLTLCDSGSEVSDEGYKSSHGNVSKIEDHAQSNADESSKSLECSGNSTLLSTISWTT